MPHCFSTLNHNLAYCYDASRAIRDEPISPKRIRVIPLDFHYLSCQ